VKVIVHSEYKVLSCFIFITDDIISDESYHTATMEGNLDTFGQRVLESIIRFREANPSTPSLLGRLTAKDSFLAAGIKMWANTKLQDEKHQVKKQIESTRLVHTPS
jgi:hypothetical protein